MRKEGKPSFVQTDNSNKTVPVRDNQTPRLELDDIKNKSIDHQCSQSEISRDSIDVAPNNSTAETAVTEGEQTSGGLENFKQKQRTTRKIRRSYTYKLV